MSFMRFSKEGEEELRKIGRKCEILIVDDPHDGGERKALSDAFVKLMAESGPEVQVHSTPFYPAPIGINMPYVLTNCTSAASIPLKGRSRRQEKKAETCILPWCEETTTHNGGYCCAEHCKEDKARRTYHRTRGW